MTVVQDMESTQALRRPRKGRASHFSQGGWDTEGARSMFHCGLASPVRSEPKPDCNIRDPQKMGSRKHVVRFPVSSKTHFCHVRLAFL